MTYNPQKHHRKSIRIPEYDYSTPGAYFITVCTHNRECLFGDIVDGEMHLNAFGDTVVEQWARTAEMRPRIHLDEFIVMPNHIHGILMMSDTGARRGTLQRAPTNIQVSVEQFGKPTSDTIPTIVRLFKSTTTKQINELRKTPGVAVWQRNYHENVIRNDASLIRIRAYIANNPAQWTLDQDHKDPFPLSSDPGLPTPGY